MGDQCTDERVMASIDEGTREFVIADIARDDAWLSMESTDALVLDDWC